jgi:hypothetical protein
MVYLTWELSRYAGKTLKYTDNMFWDSKSNSSSSQMFNKQGYMFD